MKSPNLHPVKYCAACSATGYESRVLGLFIRNAAFYRDNPLQFRHNFDRLSQILILFIRPQFVNNDS